ncbi:MAG: hypothetical protein AAFR05_21075, partial [Bacteroidota bacterium]
MRFGSIILLCGLFLFGACTSPQQSLEQGDLERALEKSSKKLRRGKVKNRHLDVFEQAFNSLNQDDRHLLDSMVASGSAEDWSEIYAVSSLIEARQTAAQPIVD